MSKNFNTFIPPYGYFLTFTTYGTWLHGDKRGSIDRRHNVIGEKRLLPNTIRYQYEKNIMRFSPFLLTHERRECVLKSIIAASDYYQWHLLAAHVRSNHVHVLLRAQETPELVMKKIKAKASHALNTLLPKSLHQAYWTRHGSTRYIHTELGMYPVMRYVINGQGEKMSCFYEKWFDEITSYDFF